MRVGGQGGALDRIGGHAWRALAMVVLSVAMAGAAQAELPHDEAGFTAGTARLLAAALPGSKVRVSGRLAASVRLAGDSSDSIAYFERPFATCQLDWAACDAFVARFVGDLASATRLRSQSITPSQLRIVVRSSDYLAPLAGTPGAVEKLLTRPLAPGLMVVCVADSPRSVRSINHGDLAALGMTEDEALARARANVAADLSGNPIPAPDPGRLGVLQGHFYESSRLALHDQWNSLAARFGGRLVVALPSNAIVLYADGRDAAAVALARTAMAHAASGPGRPISPELFAWTADGWRVLPP